MKSLDDRIRDALEEEQEGLNSIPSIAEELIGTFKGQSRWLNVLAFFISVVSFGLWIWSTVKFFQIDDLIPKLEWGGISLFFLLFVSFMKVWFWLVMQNNRVIREVKRVELLMVKNQNQ